MLSRSFTAVPGSMALAALLALWPAFTASSSAATYWVSPTGTASWENCSGAVPLTGTSACSLTTANAAAVAGDLVWLRGGTYTTHLYPANSGTGIDARIAFKAYAGEVVIIRNTTTAFATYYHGILLRSRNYIQIDGVRVDNPVGLVPAGKDRPLMITHGSSYNEIANCEIDGNGGGLIQFWDGDIAGGAPVSHNWIHDCSIHSTGALGWTGSYVDDWGGAQLGVPQYDPISGNNTIENNEFYCGGHHNLETFTKRNVIRNNFFHHAGCMANTTGRTPVYGPDSNGLWGNRNLQIYDGLNSTGMFNLVEGNRFGPSGPAPDDDGGDGLTVTAPRNIIRYNEIYGSQNNGLLLKMGSGSSANSNRIYNNTIVGAGRFRNTGPQWQGFAVRFFPSTQTASGNVLKNNIIYGAAGALDIAHANQDGGTQNKNVLENNWCTSPETAGQPSACRGFGDPLFAGSDLSALPASRLSPDLRLRTDSSAVDTGVHLAVALSAGAGSVTLRVDDALYFQDGSWGSALAGHQGDRILIAGGAAPVQIAAIDYDSNTITLAQPMTWALGAKVWLYQKSDGAQVLLGNAPDCGAHELLLPPNVPRGLRVVP